MPMESFDAFCGAATTSLGARIVVVAGGYVGSPQRRTQVILKIQFENTMSMSVEST